LKKRVHNRKPPLSSVGAEQQESTQNIGGKQMPLTIKPRVEVRWHYTDECTPAFKRLIQLLLSQNNAQSIEKTPLDEEHNNEQH